MPPLPVGSLQVAEVTLCTSLKISGLTPTCASDQEHLVDRTHFIKVFRAPRSALRSGSIRVTSAVFRIDPPPKAIRLNHAVLRSPDHREPLRWCGFLATTAREKARSVGLSIVVVTPRLTGIAKSVGRSFGAIPAPLSLRLKKCPCENVSSILFKHVTARLFRVRLPLHPEIELFHFVEGEDVEFVGDSSQTFKAGHLVLLGSKLDQRRRTEACVIQFKPEIFGEYLQLLPELARLKSLIDVASRGVAFSIPYGQWRLIRG
jgi:hypothetical protein